MPRFARAPRFLRVLCFACAASLMPLTALGQILDVTNTTSTPVPGVGHDYIKMFSETVNPANGALSIRIDVPVPQGRGITLPLAFTYNSNDGYLGVLSSNPSAAGWHSPATAYTYPQEGGWSLTLPGVSNYHTTRVGPPPYPVCRYSTSYVFIAPSGERHNLHLARVPDTASGCSTQNIHSDTYGGDDLLLATITSSKLTVSYPDGTKYNFNLYDTAGDFYAQYLLPSSIEDRNGNQILITDTVGRPIPSGAEFGTSNTNPNATNQFNMPGITNPYILQWQSIPSGSYPNTLTPVGPNNQGTCPIASAGGTPPTGVKSVTLPNGKSYQFTYDSNHGLVNKINYPSGAVVNYTWGLNANSEFIVWNGQGCEFRYGVAAITKRTVSFDGINIALEQDFSYNTTWDPQSFWSWTRKTTTVVTKDCARATSCSTAPSFTTVYTYLGDADGGNDPTQYATLGGPQMPREDTITYKNWNGTTLRTIGKVWANRHALGRMTTQTENNLVSETDYSYVGFSQLKERDDYDWGTGAKGALLKKTVLNYFNFSSWRIYDGVGQVITYDGGGAPVAETDYNYDQFTLTPTSGIVNHDDTDYPASFQVGRRNLTQVTTCLIVSAACASGSPFTTYTYDDTGQVRSMKDPCGNAACSDIVGTNHTTTYSYSDTYSSGTPPGQTNVYPTTITRPTVNTTTAHEYFKYSFDDGQLTFSQDQSQRSAGVGITYKYNDSFGRLTETDYPDGGKTTLIYNDAGPSPSVAKCSLITATTSSCTTTVMDGIGHVNQTQLTTDPEGTDTTDTTYDGLGRVRTRSNPHRATALTTDGTTSYTYDALGRVCVVVPPGGTAVTGACPTSAPAGDVFTSYVGNCATITDEAGKSRKSCTDGLGRMTKVVEGPGGLNYESDYQYDALNNLICAAQKGSDTSAFTNCASAPATWRPRSFAYDSLSRLLSAVNPESGTTSYTYDANGNVFTKTAPKPNQTSSATVVTTYAYDALNRLIQKSYNDGSTSTAKFYYDTAPAAWACCETNIVGRLVEATTNNTASEFSYDAMGRILYRLTCLPTQSWECVATPPTGEGAALHYSYDLAGNLNTYSSYTTRFTQIIDGAGRVTKLTSDLVDAQHPATLFTVDPTSGYFPNGALRKATYGNGLTQSNVYNNRLQPCRINVNSAGTLLTTCTGAAPSGNVLDFIYGFGAATANNGNVVSWNATGAQSFARTYSYDGLNRLNTYTAPAGTCTGMTWGNDAWGNRTDQTGTGGTCFNFHQSANVQNRLIGFSYDAAGNLLNDGNHSYTYDAENRLTKVDGGGTATYVYDAFGQRAERNANGSTTGYLRDLNGEIKFTVTSGIGYDRNYIYFAGKPIAEYFEGTTYFTNGDHLGSTRLLTQLDRTTRECDDYYPYGESISCGSTTGNPRKFTGKERDSESNLDYFGDRHYASALGRFMRPDAPFVDQYADDPQSWNVYSYVRNNPLRNTDPTGNACVQGENGEFHNDDSGGESCEQVDENNKNAQASATVTDQGQGAPTEAAITTADLNPFNDRAPLAFQGFVNLFLNGDFSKGGKQLLLGLGGTAVFEAVSISAKAGSGAISISKQALMHVADGHSIVVLGKAGKGAFTVGTDVTALVNAAEAVQPAAQSGQFAGRFERVVDAGHVIGVTREGVATSFYKVITDGANNLVTAFPVKP